MNNEPNPPITPAMLDAALARRLAHLNQPIIPNDRPARRLPPRPRNTYRRRRTIR